MKRCLRVAILAHSTNPRGGVVHLRVVENAVGRVRVNMQKGTVTVE